MGELFTTQVMSSTNQTSTKELVEFKEGDVFDWSSGLEESDDSQLYFCPEQGALKLKSRRRRKNIHN